MKSKNEKHTMPYSKTKIYSVWTKYVYFIEIRPKNEKQKNINVGFKDERQTERYTPRNFYNKIAKLLGNCRMRTQSRSTDSNWARETEISRHLFGLMYSTSMYVFNTIWPTIALPILRSFGSLIWFYCGMLLRCLLAKMEYRALDIGTRAADNKKQNEPK